MNTSEEVSDEVRPSEWPAEEETFSDPVHPHFSTSFKEAC